MRIFFIGILLLFTGCSSGSETTSVCYSTNRFNAAVTPSFTTTVMNVRSGPWSRIDLYLHMPFSHLRFERAVELFKGSYSVLYVIRDPSGTVVTNREVERPVVARTYQESVSSRFDMHLQSFLLSPGGYSVEIIATDQLSKLRFRTVERITANVFGVDGAAASSLLFLEDAGAGTKGFTVRPIMPSSIASMTDSFGTYQELYDLSAADTVIVTDQYRRKPDPLEVGTRTPFLTPPYRTGPDRCGNGNDPVVFRCDTVITARSAALVQLIRFLPLPAIGSTEYHHQVVAIRNGRRDTSVTQQYIYRRDPRYRTILAPEEVVQAMRFILKEDEYDSLTSASGDAQQAWIRKFWEVRGGNERRAEFERKVSEANGLFTTCQDGARTAMGIVYIICGVPDGIDCRGGYGETWYYTIGERTYGVEFRNGSGSEAPFELQPYSVNESVWQYYIERWRKRL